MHRRTLIVSIGGTVGVAGCTAVFPGDDDGTSSQYSGLEITEVAHEESQRQGYPSGEFVEVRNRGESSVNMSGVTVVYDGTRRHTFEQFILEPPAPVILLSRAGRHELLESDPPVHVHTAGFGEGVETSVLEGSGTVRLVAPNATVLDQQEYP